MPSSEPGLNSSSLLLTSWPYIHPSIHRHSTWVRWLTMPSREMSRPWGVHLAWSSESPLAFRSTAPRRNPNHRKYSSVSLAVWSGKSGVSSVVIEWHLQCCREVRSQRDAHRCRVGVDGQRGQRADVRRVGTG